MSEKFHCHDDGQSLGPYSLEEMRMYQFDGLLSSEAIAAPESAPDQWVRVSDLLAAPSQTEEIPTEAKSPAVEAPFIEELSGLPESIQPQPELITSSLDAVAPPAPESTDWMVSRTTIDSPGARAKDSWKTNPLIILGLYGAFTAICILIVYKSSNSPNPPFQESDTSKISPQAGATHSAHAKILPLIQEWKKVDAANRDCLSKRLSCIKEYDKGTEFVFSGLLKASHAEKAQEKLLSIQNSARNSGADPRLTTIIKSMAIEFDELERKYSLSSSVSSTIDEIVSLIRNFNVTYVSIQKSNTDKLIQSIAEVQIYKCNERYRSVIASLLTNLNAHKAAQSEKMIEDEGKHLDAIANDIRDLNSAAR